MFNRNAYGHYKTELYLYEINTSRTEMLLKYLKEREKQKLGGCFSACNLTTALALWFPDNGNVTKRIFNIQWKAERSRVQHSFSPPSEKSQSSNILLLERLPWGYSWV